VASDRATGPARGLTPREFARLYRLGVERVRAMIVRGELQALNLSPTRRGKPRYVVMPHHVEAWERSRRVNPPPRPAPRRRRPVGETDYFPDL
jgi:hypothetical protein